MKCVEEYNPTVLMHLVFGNQRFEPIETIISFRLQSENLKAKWEPNFNNNIPIQKKHDPSFCDLTLEKEQTSYKQIFSNLYILFKTNLLLPWNVVFLRSFTASTIWLKPCLRSTIVKMLNFQCYQTILQGWAWGTYLEV
jgi:hypothetical protein